MFSSFLLEGFEVGGGFVYRNDLVDDVVSVDVVYHCRGWVEGFPDKELRFLILGDSVDRRQLWVY